MVIIAERMRRIVLAVGFFAFAVPALAQEPATSIDQLRVLVRPGDAITLMDASGREVKGTVEAFSESSLALIVGKSEQTIQQADIRTIRQRKDDSLADGARKGFAIGATMGFLMGVAALDYFGPGFLVMSTGLYGAVGAGIGAGLDAMVTKDRTIYDSGWQKPRAFSVKVLSW